MGTVLIDACTALVGLRDKKNALECGNIVTVYQECARKVIQVSHNEGWLATQKSPVPQ